MEEVEEVKRILDRYENFSGQKVNFTKSNIMLSRNVEGTIGAGLAGVFGVRVVVDQAKQRSNPSYVWRSILESQKVMRNGARIRIGGGKSTRVWQDPWLVDAGRIIVTDPIPILQRNALVSQLMVDESRAWDANLVRDIFFEEIAAAVLRVPLSIKNIPDRWFWLLEKKETLALKVVTDWFEVRKEAKWICSSVESVAHLFMDCGFAKDCWIQAGLGVVSVSGLNFSVWLKSWLKDLEEEDACLAAMVCWNIWIHRNNIVWSAKRGMVVEVLNNSGHQLVSWRRARASSHPAALCLLDKGDGRDSNGVVIHARAVNFLGNFDSRVAEIMGIREALSWVKVNQKVVI
ncbi:uncharacterized protein LOC126672215 [Mercurialis annua]|uniref:uncharacterized protein LOC126672215 n=1 Tax=Mercurialis annua TaxID=3986 RepID=UPI0021605883|nr:uncharacterized protein LOC126672215 [Mercurialis annua]